MSDGASPRRILTVVGGGVHVCTLAEALAAHPDLPELELRLVATNGPRLDVIGTHLAALVAQRRAGWTVSWGTDVDRGVEGADAVVLLVRVGGSVARSHDERFPTLVGLVGDEGIGPGGMANAWRTVPVIEHIAGRIRVGAPDALVANMVAPLGVTTSVVAAAGLRVAGVCELPAMTWAALEHHVAAVSRERFRARCGFGGVNHLSWFWPTTDWAADVLHDAAIAAKLVDPVTWHEFGGVPMPYFYRVVAPDRGRLLGIGQPAGRAEELQELTDAALVAMRAHPGRDVAELRRRPTPWFDQALAPVLVGWFGGVAYEGPLNAVADGRGGVVESMGEVRAARVTVRTPPTPPSAIAASTGVWARIEQLVVRASVDRDRAALADAMALLPFELTIAQRNTLVDAVTCEAVAS